MTGILFQGFRFNVMRNMHMCTLRGSAVGITQPVRLVSRSYFRSSGVNPRLGQFRPSLPLHPFPLTSFLAGIQAGSPFAGGRAAIRWIRKAYSGVAVSSIIGHFLSVLFSFSETVYRSRWNVFMSCCITLFFSTHRVACQTLPAPCNACFCFFVFCFLLKTICPG